MIFIEGYLVYFSTDSEKIRIDVNEVEIPSVGAERFIPDDPRHVDGVKFQDEIGGSSVDVCPAADGQEGISRLHNSGHS